MLDLALREQQIAELMPLASQVVAGMTMPASLREDACGDALVGIVKAVDRYKPGLGMTLRGYARQRAVGEVLDGLRRTGWLSRTDYTRARPLLDAGGEVAAHQMAPVSLDGLNGIGSDGNPIEQQLQVADTSAAVDDNLEREWLEDILNSYSVLSEKERAVLQRRLDGATMADIAFEYRVTESRICQIVAKAVRRLRQVLQDQMELEAADS